MNKKEINSLIDIYIERGEKELIKHLYNLRKIEEEKELRYFLEAYMHLTNEQNNSLYYSSPQEQIVTNNTSSIIYFNKNIFSFENINNRKIVTKNSLEVNKDSILVMLDKVKELFGKQSSTIKDSIVSNNYIEFLGKDSYQKFDYQECELIRKLLDSPTFLLSDTNDILYASGNNGYAYVLGIKSSKDKSWK